MQDPSKPIWFKKPEEVENINKEEKISIMVCTPVHSEVSMHYTQALLEFQKFCMLKNIWVSFVILKSSLVTQGRNLCVANFLNADHKYTHLLFIDSDINFSPESIFEMIALDREVIAIPYPMKTINWDKVDRLSKEIKYKNSTELSTLGFTYPIKVADTSNIIVQNNVIEVTHAPTGCMLIKRQVFDKMIEKYPHLEIYQPTILNGEETKTNNLYNFFDTFHDLESKKYYGEDFGFCQKWRDIGGKCYCYINRFITHVGEYQYSGRFRDELNYMTKIDELDKNK
jgi:hypothetical protein